MTAPLCESCAEAHKIVPAEVHITWDLGSKWLCKECAKMQIADLEKRRAYQ